jgi:hypothetical protein
LEEYALEIKYIQNECMHIDNGNNTIVMRATIAIATTAKMPAH